MAAIVTTVRHPNSITSNSTNEDTALVTAPCDVEGFCYQAADSVKKYLNSPAVWEALSPPEQVKEFTLESQAVVDAFGTTPEVMTTSSNEVLILLASGVHFLAYQGNLDLACNTAGTLRWANALPWKGQTEFASKSLVPWISNVDGQNKTVGTTKEVQIKLDGQDEASRFAFVTIDGAGHLVGLQISL